VLESVRPVTSLQPRPRETCRVPPAEFEDEAPYTFAVVELEEGLLLPARLEAAHDDKILEIGAPVEFASEDDRGALFRLS